MARLGVHGNTKWTPTGLLTLALCWAWSEARGLTDAFGEALGQCRRLASGAVPTTYQGFMLAMLRWSGSLVPLVLEALHTRMEEIGGRWWRLGRWVPIAFDGSRSSAPRTLANEAAFCAANYGRGKTAKHRRKKSRGLRRKRNEQHPTTPPEPQVWITMLWHLGLRLPWTWRLGPSNASERGHVMEMLTAGRFPNRTLFCGDAGFVGHPLWSRIRAQGHHFLVRVGHNVRLLAESAVSDFGTPDADGIVLCWPKAVQAQNLPPLRLRLLKIRLGTTPMWMLTSVLDSEHLPAREVVRLYTLRWGVEVQFRGLKQTLDRAKLRCRNDQRLLVELDWSILAMAVAELFALQEQLAAKPTRATRAKPYDPAKRSLAATMRAMRHSLRHVNEVPRPGEDLATRLRAARTDDYVRRNSKKARYRKRNPDKKPLGDPHLRQLTPLERVTMLDHTP